MALVWVVLLLFAGVCVAVENTQALSQRCEDDTNTFVLEINQDRPKEYAVLSKCFDFSACMSSFTGAFS